MKTLELQQMENVAGGDAASVICNVTTGLIGGIFGAAIAAYSFRAATPVRILAGAVISATLSEMAC